MHSDPQVKTFQITGGAEVFGSKKSARGGSRKKKDEDAVPMVRKEGGTQIATAGVLPLAVASPVIGYRAPSAPPLQGPSTAIAYRPLLQQGGQEKQENHKDIRRVELRKPIPSRKVQLNPKKHKIITTKDKTRKVRKITIGLSSIQNRVTRAKKIKEHMKEMPLEDLRKELIKRGLIKESSKAPESILRQIASDAQIISGKGL
jgi:hypothetical protein